MSAADRVPAWSWAAPLGAGLYLAARAAGWTGSDGIEDMVGAAVLPALSVFAAVHHAEVLALRLGEPFGSILLAVAVTVIEVALIVSILLSGAENSAAVARDTVFAAVMIVLNGVVGLCLVLGGIRHRVQTFRIDGAAPTLAVIGTPATLALVIPNFAEAERGPVYSTAQLVAVGAAGLPSAAVGVAIAMLVLLPEGLAAAKAALTDRLQSSVNLALGSAVASIGLTIPVVAVVSVAAGLPLALGLSGKTMVLLLLTLFAATLTLGTGRTTVLHGAVHLVIFAVFLLLTVIP